MEKASHHAQVVRFATFEVDLQAGEIRKSGLKLKLSTQPFQVLAILLEQPGTVVTREQLEKRLWPDTFVDVDHNLNTAINKIREALGDSAENPRFVETLPRRGYRFIAPIDESAELSEKASQDTRRKSDARFWAMRWRILAALVVLLSIGGLFFYKTLHVAGRPVQRALTRLTFDDGLQIGATWSPDGRFIAYSSNRGGKFDIWVQQVSGGNPIQITKGTGQHWQPDWSPDGKFIAYRSESGEGGLYIIPALGGEGLERKIASFGYYPRWSPDSSQVLFQTNFAALGLSEKFWLVGLGGDAPREVFSGWQILEAPQMQPERLSASWHPDGRISIWASPTGSRTYSPTFWTVPISGGTPSRLEIAPELVEQFKGISSGPFPEPSQDFKFSWAPSGKAIYFERTFRGAQNIWRMNIGPRTLRAVGIERLTTGTGFDTESSVSSDGKKLAFTGESRHVRVWLFSFDAKLGRISGAGQPVTSAEIESWGQEISRDGTKLIFRGTRGGKTQLWEKSLVNGREAPIIAEDSYSRSSPQWSPDGSKLAYVRFKPITKTAQLVIWSSRNRSEEPITTIGFQPYDWSPDSKWLLASLTDPQTGLTEIWQVPVASSPHAARKLVSDPSYEFYQPHFSPDGRWIVFEAVTFPSNSNSSLYVIPASGGPWIPITKGHPWDDKPHWSPDGKMIYYLSLQEGLFNVSGIHFDPAMGKPIGEPFRVTSFQYPGPVFANRIMSGQLSLTEDKLVLTMEDRSGSIWMLDNVDR